MGGPSWGVRKSAAPVTVVVAVALCAVPAGAYAAPKRGKWKPTVALVKETVTGVALGEVGVADAKCPEGYDVLGGSYLIGGGSVFAHAAGAAPFLDKGLYRAVVANPLVNPFAGVPAADASVTAAAICAESGRPVVVDGPIGQPGSPTNGGLAPTVSSSVETAPGILNGDVRRVDSGCRSGGSSIFGGGFTIDGTLWGHTSSSAVLSKPNDYSATLVTLPSNPSLGVFKAQASLRVVALCSRNGRPMVFNGGVFPAGSATAAKPKPKKKKKPKQRGTVVLTRKTVGGITSGRIATVSTKCPKGYSVFGGSHIIGGNSALAHATVAAVTSKRNAYSVTVVNPPVNINAGIPKTTASVIAAANCARRATPIVVDGPFPSG
jgi:hypothetical protein